MNTIYIEKLVYGGHGLGRDEAGVVLVPGTAPGEAVEYEDDGLQGGIRLGRVTKIIEPSPCRREAPCVYAGECGGCDWLHLFYDEQVRCKKEIFLDCIKRIGKFNDHPEDIDVFTADEFGYRLRAQVKVDHQNKRAGFFRRKTNDVVRVDRCPLLADEINYVLTKLNGGMIEAVSGDANSIKILSGKTVASHPAISDLTNADTEIEVGGITFLADGGSFFQSNKFLLETMGRWFADSGTDRCGNGYGNEYGNGYGTGQGNGRDKGLKPLAENLAGRGGYCLDLYGGIGFFSLMLSGAFEKIILVENIPAQVQAAKRNFRHNGQSHIEAVLADVDRGDDLDRLTKEKRPDCVIVDPPRPGLVKKTRKWLVDTAPPVILYVSCNPSTFARDAGALVNGGYKLTQWALFDLYPNTHHIESAAVFEK